MELPEPQGWGLQIEAGTKLGRAGPTTAKSDAQSRDRERNVAGRPCPLANILLPSALIGCMQLAVSLARHPVEGRLPVIQGRAMKGSEDKQACGATSLCKEVRVASKTT